MSWLVMQLGTMSLPELDRLVLLDVKVDMNVVGQVPSGELLPGEAMRLSIPVPGYTFEP